MKFFGNIFTNTYNLLDSGTFIGL